MLNLYDAVLQNPTVRRLAVGDFLFAMFTCGIGDEQLGLWSQQDYLIHVLAGKKTWHTDEGVFAANQGESLFFKKGAAVVEQHLETDFCLLIFFIPDELVRSTVREVAGSLPSMKSAKPLMHSATRVVNDTPLSAFLTSIRAYFADQDVPSEPLLRLKLKELILSILTSGENTVLAAYFRRLAESESPAVAEIMEANFRHNLSLEEFARLCHRSLSSFKREFQSAFQESPGRWLMRKRVDYAAALIRGTSRSLTDIAFDSGFEDVSHFSRAFKQRFGVAPLAYRKDVPTAD